MHQQLYAQSIEGNIFSNCNIAVNLADTSNNIINSNKIIGAQDAIVLRNITNDIIHNKVQNSTYGIVLLNSSAGNHTNIDKDHVLDQVTYTGFLTNLTMLNEMTDVKNPIQPKHEILSKKQAEEVLKKYNTKPSQLPYILINDKGLEDLDVRPGDIIKITRMSSTAGESVYYRYVVED